MKKNKTINLRISEELYQKIKKKAIENKDTISNTTRTFIQDSCELISDLAGELLNKTHDELIFEHEVKIISEHECSLCKKKIKKGSKLIVQEMKSGIKKFVCKSCEN